MTELTPAHFHVIDKNKAKSKETDKFKKEIDRLSEENKNLKTIIDGLQKENKQLKDPLNGFRKDGGL
nr:viral A-type inclusion protein [uncultured Mediterranean phage uvMED]